MPAYHRQVSRKKPKVVYSYSSKGGKVVKDSKLIKELNCIKVPATYNKVVLHPGKKLHATGYDQTGRKQYFYSQVHRERAAKQKYCSLIHLGKKLDTILKDIENLLKIGQKGKINQDVIDAIALKVMILCNFRVGSRNNRNKYKTYGLTTITKEHLKVRPNKAEIKFTGKKQQINQCTITDKQTVHFLRKLAKYRDKLDKRSHQTLFRLNGHTVTPESLNSFLYRYNPDITTKTWRTWFANISYIQKIIKSGNIPETKTARKKLSNDIIKLVAEELHHTPAINKRSYLAKELLELFVETPGKWIKLVKNKRNINNIFCTFLEAYCEEKSR